MDPNAFMQFAMSLIQKAPTMQEPMDLKTMFSTVGAAAGASEKLKKLEGKPEPQLPPPGAQPIGMGQPAPSPAMGAVGGAPPPAGAGTSPLQARLAAVMGR